MKYYNKLFVFLFAISTTMVAKSQQFFCWKNERVKYDWNLNEYIILSTTPAFDTISIDKFQIKFRRNKIDLTKRREISKWSNNQGITTTFESIYNESKMVTIRVIEIETGVSQIIIMESQNSDTGTAYHVKELIEQEAK